MAAVVVMMSPPAADARGRLIRRRQCNGRSQVRDAMHAARLYVRGLLAGQSTHNMQTDRQTRVARFFLGTLIGTCRTENRPRTAGLAENQTRVFFASGRQAGRANADWPSMLFFTDRVRIQKNVGSKTPDSEPTRKCDFFRAPPPFHSLRKPFRVRRKRPPALLSEIWLDLA